MNKVILICSLIVLYQPVPGFSEDAKQLYKLFCSQCHGITGNGKGINSGFLPNNPQNHTDSAYMSSRTDEQLQYVIMEGGIGISKSPVMPSWKHVFTNEQVTSLVKYLRELCQCKYESIISNLKLRTVNADFR